MTRPPTRSLATLAALLLTATASAAPKLDAAQPAGTLMLYPDDRRPDVLYYGPGEIVLAAEADGQPPLSFLQVRYTGTVAAGQAGTAVLRSLLTLRVAQAGVGPQDIAAARRAARLGGSIELRPLPIGRLDAKLAYTPIGTASPAATPAGASDGATPLPEGHFEAADAAPRDDGYWTERTYTLALSAAEAQVFADSLREGRLLLSLDYAFVAAKAGAKKGEPGGNVVVRAGAASVAVDARRWPSVVRRIDLNDRVPPGYAAVDVYCYDFRDALRPDLYEKQVDVEADGVGGRPVTASATFDARSPDLYARRLRFPVAVRLDRPFRFRVIETAADGVVRGSGWKAATSWHQVVDVTTPPEAQAARRSTEAQP